MMACAYAAAFGAIQQMPRIVPGLAEVRALARPAQEQTISAVQSFQEFGGLAGRVLLAFLAGRHRQPPPAAARVPGPRADPAAAGVPPRADQQPDAARSGASCSWAAHDHRAVQLLGELPAARLPDAPARHRRELRGERRRPDDRHLRGARDHAARRRRCPARRSRSSSPTRRRSSAPSAYVDRRSSPASGCRSRRRAGSCRIGGARTALYDP